MDTNLVYCTSCGATNAAEARVCFKCGAPIQVEGLKRVESKFQALKCPMCGANVKQYDRECSYCGSTLMIISLEKAFASNINIEILASSVLKWKDVLENDPNNPEANYALGLTYLNQKLRDAALQHLQKASLLIPESPIIHYNLAVTLFNDGNCELDSEDYKNVVKEIDYALLLDPSFREAKAFKHFFIARKLDRINEAEAIKEYEAAIQECLDIAVLHNNLGLANYKIKNYSNARTCYLKAIEIDPEYLLAFNNLCLLCYSTGKYEDGVQYGNKAIELIRPTTLDTSQAFAYNNLSLCLWKTGRWDEAIQMMDRALAIRPNDPLFQANRKNIQTDKPLPPLTEKVRSRIKRNNAILIVLGILFVLALVTIYMWSSLGSH